MYYVPQSDQAARGVDGSRTSGDGRPAGELESIELGEVIRKAIRCGPIPNVRDWRKLPHEELTKAEQIMAFAEMYLVIPSGQHVGKPLKLELFQEAFLYAVFDNPNKTNVAVLSIARRNSKTFLTAVILLAYLAGPMASTNVNIASAANSRDQAGLIYKAIHDMVLASPVLYEHIHLQQSKKQATGLFKNASYFSMSADARTGFGQSLKVVVLDESGQIKGPETAYTSMLRTSQGSYDDPLFVTISTQAESDSDYLSVLMDDAIREQDLHTVVHLYTTPENFDILDPEGWKYSNPALNKFRSEKDLKDQLQQASRISSLSARAQNLLLNRRIAQDNLWLAPEIWRDNSRTPNIEALSTCIIACGIDLSLRTDLTAAVLAWLDEDGDVSLLPFVYTPLDTIREREARDRAPYSGWLQDNHLIGVPGAVINYQFVAEHLHNTLQQLGITIHKVCFDRWRIDDFRRASAEKKFGLEAEWLPVGQGFHDMSPRIEAFETLLLEKRIRHGGHPLLNFAASGTITTKDASGNRKLDKSKVTKRIDPIVAAVMSAYAVSEGAIIGEAFDPFAIIG